MSRRVDAHQHFWRLDRGDYGWLTPAMGSIHRDFMPSDFAPLVEKAGIDATVLVQAAPTEAETHFMLSLAERHDFVRGVVGWTDFEAADAPQRIAALAAQPLLKGLRPMIQDIPDPDWMLRPELDAAFRALIGHDLVFDALVLPRHLENLLQLAERYPEMRIVIDHCAKPQIATGEIAAWTDAMARLARNTRACCKLSGLVTEAGADWTVDRLRPVFDHVLECFGPQRLVWGSDWPVATLAAGYADWVEATDLLLRESSSSERDAVLGGNAVSLYGLEA